MAHLAAAWRRWLVGPGNLRALAAFRIGWAAAMLVAAADDWGRAALYSPERYHAPMTRWAAPVDAARYHTLMGLAAIGCAMTFVGLLPRLGAAAVCAINGYLLLTDALLFRNHIYLGCLLGLLLAASPCGRALSIDALVRKVVGWPPLAAPGRASSQVIKAQVLIVYFWSVVNKLRPSFLDGWTLQQEVPHALAESPIAWLLRAGDGGLRPIVVAAIESDRGMAMCSWAVVIVEAFLFWGLPRRRWRPYAVVAGLALHGAIFALMGVFTFGLLMVSSYPLFFDRGDDDARGLTAKGAGRRPDTPSLQDDRERGDPPLGRVSALWVLRRLRRARRFSAHARGVVRRPS